MTDSRETLGELALAVFALNGQFLDVAERIAKGAGTTATRWQVLGAVADGALTQSDIARKMGITRQSVLRTVHQLAGDGLVALHENPAHKTAQLVTLTERGTDVLARIRPRQAAFAAHLAETMGLRDMQRTLDSLRVLQTALEDASHRWEDG